MRKLYTPEELKDVQLKLKQIIEVWNANEIKDEIKTMENWIILALHKQGYRIINVGLINKG